MSKTKIVITLAAIAALTLVIVGLASAQIVASQIYAGAKPSTAAPNGGFMGWIGNCFGLRNSQPNGNQYILPQVPPTADSVPAPNQGGYGSGYSYGPCRAR